LEDQPRKKGKGKPVSALMVAVKEQDRLEAAGIILDALGTTLICCRRNHFPLMADARSVLRELRKITAPGDDPFWMIFEWASKNGRK